MNCVNHPDKKSYSGGLCYSCRTIQRYEDNPELRDIDKAKKKERNAAFRNSPKRKAWLLANHEKLREQDRNRHRNTPKVKITKLVHHFKKSYGLLLDDFNQMVEDQSGQCKICLAVPKENQRLCVDHDHNSGKVRGLLCRACNAYLGKLESRVGTISRLQIYMTEHGIPL